MLIDDAILGLLNDRPMSGYDLKKLMLDSPYMIWSGNNNQIYKALLQLAEHGLVSGETVHRDGTPSKKVYAITAKGRDALGDWLAAAEPELPELRQPFLVQLAVAARVDPSRLEAFLHRYLDEIEAQLKMLQERRRRLAARAGDDTAASFIEAAIDDKIISFYEGEAEWVQTTRQSICGRFPKEDET